MDDRNVALMATVAGAGTAGLLDDAGLGASAASAVGTEAAEEDARGLDDVIAGGSEIVPRPALSRLDAGPVGAPSGMAGAGPVPEPGVPVPVAPGVPLPEEPSGVTEPVANPCDPATPFAEPALMPGVGSTFDDYGFWLARDGLTAVFASNRTDLGGPGDYDLYTSTRSSLEADFEEPRLLPIVNSPTVERKPVLSPDGLRLFFTSGRPAARDDEDIYVAIRPNSLSEFEQPGLLSRANSNVGDLVHSIDGDGRFLYFDRVVGAARREIFALDLASNEAPQPVAEINSVHDEGHAVVSDDLLTVYWATTRVGLDPAEGSAESNIWRAQRATPTAAFTDLTPVSELNTDAGETVHYLSADGCTLYLGSGRSGRQQLWVAHRSAP